MEAPHNYLPGPVTVEEGVRRAFAAPAISHRGAQFRARFEQVRRGLCRRVGARRLHLVAGSGTLANDIVAAQLALRRQRGVVLVNGEFGRRLVDHARRAGLDFEILEVEEGRGFDRPLVAGWLAGRSGTGWLWAVACETATGVVNDLEMLKELCRDRNIALCIDAISAIGSYEIDLDGVALATATSGKGIGSLPGVGMIFASQPPLQGPNLPRCFDLSLSDGAGGIPFTFSSNALEALAAALEGEPWSERRQRFEGWSRRLRKTVEAMGLEIVADPACRAPHVTTVALPPRCRSFDVGERLLEEGIWISYRSDHLLRRNWIQFCFMGACAEPPARLWSLLRQVTRMACA